MIDVSSRPFLSRTVRRVALAASLAVLPLITPCACSRSDGDAGPGTGATPVRGAVATIQPASGSSVHGTVTFTLVDAGTRVHVELTGLSPGPHGFHIHESGDCSAPDASSAGGHFAPHGSPHGARTAEVRHVGDLGNVVADEEGRVETTFTDSRIALSGENSILDRAVVVHGSADDLISQPSGAAGPRVACGTIVAQG